MPVHREYRHGKGEGLTAVSPREMHMNWIARHRIGWTCALAVLSTVLVLSTYRALRNARDRSTILRLTENMHAVCVGRFLIDLPADAQIDVRSRFVGGFDIESSDNETEEEFDTRFNDLESQVVAVSDGGRSRRLETPKVFGVDGARGKVVVYDRQRGETLEGGHLAEIEDVSVKGILRVKELSVMASATHRPLDVGKRLEQMLGQIRPLNAREIPFEEGFCIDRAIVRDPFEHKGNESIVLVAGLPGHRDVNIVFSSNAGATPVPGLLERHEKNRARHPILMRLAFKYLRQRLRTINGLTGDELVTQVRESNLTTGYSFHWEMAGKQNDLYAPHLLLELESGVNPVAGGDPVQSTLSQEAMLDLWERIVSSIRVRRPETVEPLSPDPPAESLPRVQRTES